MFPLALLLAVPLAVAAGPLQKRISGAATYYNVQTGNACVASLERLPSPTLIINHRFYSAVAPVVHFSTTATLYVPSVAYGALFIDSKHF